MTWKQVGSVAAALALLTDTSGTIVFTDIGSWLWVPIHTTTLTAAIG